jgi:hypothetical protein
MPPPPLSPRRIMLPALGRQDLATWSPRLDVRQVDEEIVPHAERAAARDA